MGEFPGKSMLAGATANDENFHQVGLNAGRTATLHSRAQACAAGIRVVEHLSRGVQIAEKRVTISLTVGRICAYYPRLPVIA